MENFRSLPNHLHLHPHQKSQTPNKSTIENKPIKVKYISSPMMVKANNESEFRAIVQKLTGQHSADDATFDQSPEQFNHAFYPPPTSSTPASFDTKDCYNGLASGDVYNPIGVGDGRYWPGEMEGSFPGFQASSCVNIW